MDLLMELLDTPALRDAADEALVAPEPAVGIDAGVVPDRGVDMSHGDGLAAHDGAPATAVSAKAHKIGGCDPIVPASHTK